MITFWVYINTYDTLHRHTRILLLLPREQRTGLGLFMSITSISCALDASVACTYRNSSVMNPTRRLYCARVTHFRNYNINSGTCESIKHWSVVGFSCSQGCLCRGFRTTACMRLSRKTIEVKLEEKCPSPQREKRNTLKQIFSYRMKLQMRVSFHYACKFLKINFSGLK